MLSIIFFTLMLSITQCLGDTCYCSCCTGNHCQPTLLANLTVSSCALISCENLCKSHFPQQCTDGSGSTSYICKSSPKPSNTNWVGVFDVGNNCDQRFCCCPTGQLTNTKVNDALLHINGRFIGTACNGGSITLDDDINMPSGYETQLYFLGNYIDVTLSQDNRIISMINKQFPQCSESARRTGTSGSLKININSILIFLSIFLFIFQ